MDILKALTPATSGQYWYFSAYFALFFIMPLLRIVLVKLEGKQLHITAMILLIIFSVLPTLRHVDSFMFKDGYSMAWLAVMYFLGGYIKKTNLLNKLRRRTFAGIFFGSVAVLIGSKLVIEAVAEKLIGEVIGGGYLIGYMSPVVIVEAVALLGMLNNIRLTGIGAKILCRVSECSFSVFLIHEHPLIKHTFISDKFTQYLSYPTVVTVLAIIGTMLAIYLICTVIDFLRSLLFTWLKVNTNCDRFVTWLYTAIQKRWKGAEQNEK